MEDHTKDKRKGYYVNHNDEWKSQSMKIKVHNKHQCVSEILISGVGILGI